MNEHVGFIDIKVYNTQTRHMSDQVGFIEIESKIYQQ